MNSILRSASKHYIELAAKNLQLVRRHESQGKLVPWANLSSTNNFVSYAISTKPSEFHAVEAWYGLCLEKAETSMFMSAKWRRIPSSHHWGPRVPCMSEKRMRETKASCKKSITLMGLWHVVVSFGRTKKIKQT